VSVTPSEDIEVKLNIALPSGCNLTEGATSKWQVCWINTDNEGNDILLCLALKCSSENRPDLG
jgi:hypothetical protein